MKVNGGDFILRWYSGGISLQNTSPVEKNEDYFILWNSGYNERRVSEFEVFAGVEHPRIPQIRVKSK
jgi:hypothetical protein